MLAARTGLSPVMVGRSAPLHRLSGLLDGPHPDGLAAVALVTGEPGVGKTRLVQELIRALPARAVVLAGGAEPGSLGRPYDVVRSMLDGSLPAADDGGRAALDTIAGRIGDRGALVVFEDLHWADAESVAVFEALATAPLPSTLVIATCRQDELTRRLPAGEMLERLERRHFVHHVHLERLGRAEVGAFLTSVHGRVPPSGLVDTLHGRTGGNPFFLEEILNVAGDVDPVELDRLPLPWSLAELVRAQLDGLSPDERRLVEAAAILARRAEFDVLAEVTGRSEDELIGVLRGLLDRGVLMEECEDSFTFRHALVRDAVEQQLLGRERRRLHELALEALRRSPCEDLAALADHARGAGRYDEFVALARQGGVSYLAGGSSHQALRLASDALAEEPDDPALLAVAARAAWLLGLYDEALGHAERWHRGARAGSPGEQAAAARLLARVLHEMDRVDEMWSAVAGLERLVDELPAGEDRALTMAWLAQLHMVRMRSRDAVAWAERAIAEADAVGAKGVRAQALVERASAIGELPGRYAEAGDALREAVAEAEAVGDWVLLARALNNLSTYVPLGSPEGRSLLDRLQEVNERAGFDGMGAHYRFRLAEVAIVDGDRAEARRLIDSMPSTGWGPHLQASYHVLAGVVAVEEGRIDAAATAVDAARPTSRPYDQAMFLSLALVVASIQGDDDEVTRSLDAVLEHTPHQGFHIDPAGIVDRLEALERAGRAADAPGMVAAWRERVLPGPFVDVADGLVAALEQRHDDAVARLQAALDSGGLHVAAYQRARVGVVLAASLTALGHQDEALVAARAARQDLVRWPGWRRDEVDGLLQRLGDGSAGGAGADGDLTAREREVAVLLADGLTNAEVARRLYISPKTAAVHVSNILMKLGMSSRAEVAAWAVRTGLAPGGKGAARRL